MNQRPWIRAGFMLLLCGAAGWALWLALPVAGSSAAAAPADYRFELVGPAVKTGSNVALDVRITHTPTGKPVDNAVIFRTRLDMSPDNMADMTANVRFVPPAKQGVYRFAADLTDAGNWALALSAKVPGEEKTVTGRVIVRVIP